MTKNRRSLENVTKFRASRASSIISELNAAYGDDEVLYVHKKDEPLIGKFARLKYGDDLELIFNIDCQVQNVFDYFRRNCSKIIQEGQVIDVVDLNGNMMNLRENMNDFCSLKLNARQTYILVAVTTSQIRNHKTDKIQALLYQSELLTNEFLKKVSEYTKNKMNKMIIKNEQKITNRIKMTNESSILKYSRRGTLI
ncbi:hypothetical protein BpHYR1_019546 [Brachionus plicatilis]|uniref:Uncharacterized protein n=1 Tax=Brachionus plicatilis TaxID=10195 RepID=A0A3M7R9N7_BRAPC|nr:hypothetical protein BpHYR1_019546 [Brachionus plicatilis]